MTIDIQALIAQRQHLKDPLELYGKWQRFEHGVAEHLPEAPASMSPEKFPGYAQENAGQIFQSFLYIFDLPAEEFEPLGRALERGSLDFMRFPLGEFPDLSLPIPEDDLASVLFLLSRPYFLALRKTSQLVDPHWKDGLCPLCSARPVVASIAEGPRRILHCSWCGTAGPYKFTGCPNCGTGDTAKLNMLVPDEEPGFRISTCDRCRTYTKIVEGSVLDAMKADLADLTSLPLDIIAQEKGYSRKAPNAIGLQKMAQHNPSDSATRTAQRT